MNKVLLQGLALLSAAALLTACGQGETAETDTDTAETSSAVISSAENSSPAYDSSSTAKAVMSLKTYKADDVPELVTAVGDIVKGAQGSIDDFAEVFDPQMIFEALVRVTAANEEEAQEMRDEFDDEAADITLRADYQLLHDSLAADPPVGEVEDLTIQCYAGTLETNTTFLLNFDMECESGKVTFVGSAYRIDGVWGAMFEPAAKDGGDIDGLLNSTEEDEK